MRQQITVWVLCVVGAHLGSFARDRCVKHHAGNRSCNVSFRVVKKNKFVVLNFVLNSCNCVLLVFKKCVGRSVLWFRRRGN